MCCFSIHIVVGVLWAVAAGNALYIVFVYQMEAFFEPQKLTCDHLQFHVSILNAINFSAAAVPVSILFI